ncbi:MAG: GIY-YIG nuclease family protein [Patescibacteria group bacterium]
MRPDRWEQHLSLEGARYTREHKPKEMVYVEEHDNLEEARKRERQIKDWS